MHDYSLRGHPRERLVYFLAAAAFSVMPLATSLAGWLGVTKAVSTFTVFTLLFIAFDKWLWRLRWFRSLAGIPDLNGTWTCQGCQMDAEGKIAREWTGKVRIKQSWSRIAVCLQTDTSTSRSGPASIAKDEGVGFCLLYAYTNEPLPGNPGMSPHHGTCEITFDEACASGHGVYFNDFNRQTCGRLKLTREEEK